MWAVRDTRLQAYRFRYVYVLRMRDECIALVETQAIGN
jgi:hypothetical protein